MERLLPRAAVFLCADRKKNIVRLEENAHAGMFEDEKM
jgi:hypothetical protein